MAREYATLIPDQAHHVYPDASFSRRLKVRLCIGFVEAARRIRAHLYVHAT